MASLACMRLALANSGVFSYRHDPAGTQVPTGYLYAFVHNSPN